MPPASSTSAALATSSGTSGLLLTPWRKLAVRAAISIDPASAVPRDAPRLVTVFCRPPTSALRSSGTAETVTAPSCEASAPTPRPARSSGTVTISAPAPTSRARISDTVPASRATRPQVTTRRGEAWGQILGTPTAARRRVTDSGSSRIPVSTALRPRATDKNSGTVKKRPDWMRNWKKNIVSPPTSGRCAACPQTPGALVRPPPRAAPRGRRA